jgi:transcriptional regulator with XRE-family HTH domain
MGESSFVALPLDNELPFGNNSLMAESPPSTSERLRVRLKELGWTQLDLAVAIGVSGAVVSRWLSGDRVPSLEMAFRIQNSEVGIPADAWIDPPDADESGAHAAVASPRSA